MEKVIKDGKVGVLVSPGYGAGFYTWGAPQEAIFNPTLVQLIQNEKFAEAIRFVQTNWEDTYTGGMRDLVVIWIPQGSVFQIVEYDGSESLVLMDEIHWITA
jgi:hypothetical protein